MEQVGKDATRDRFVALRVVVVMLQVTELIVEFPVLVDEVDFEDDGPDEVVLAGDIVDIVDAKVISVVTLTVEVC